MVIMAMATVWVGATPMRGLPWGLWCGLLLI